MQTPEQRKEYYKRWCVLNKNKIKAYRKAIYASVKGKAASQAYYKQYYLEHKKTEEGRAKQRAFQNTEEGRAYLKQYNKAWVKSTAGRKYMREYQQTPERKLYIKEYNKTHKRNKNNIKT